MPETYKVLGQSNPTATTETTLYVVPASTSTVVSSFVVCNRGASIPAFRMSIAVTGVTTEAKQYLYYDVPVQPYESLSVVLGLTLAATDKVQVYSSHTDLSFNLFGTEIT